MGKTSGRRTGAGRGRSVQANDLKVSPQEVMSSSAVGMAVCQARAYRGQQEPLDLGLPSHRIRAARYLYPLQANWPCLRRGRATHSDDINALSTHSQGLLRWQLGRLNIRYAASCVQTEGFSEIEWRIRENDWARWSSAADGVAGSAPQPAPTKTVCASWHKHFGSITAAPHAVTPDQWLAFCWAFTCRLQFKSIVTTVQQHPGHQTGPASMTTFSWAIGQGHGGVNTERVPVRLSRHHVYGNRQTVPVTCVHLDQF